MRKNLKEIKNNLKKIKSNLNLSKKPAKLVVEKEPVKTNHEPELEIFFEKELFSSSESDSD